MKRNYRKRAEPTLDDGAIEAGLRRVIVEHERKLAEEQAALNATEDRIQEVQVEQQSLYRLQGDLAVRINERTAKLKQLREAL